MNHPILSTTINISVLVPPLIEAVSCRKFNAVLEKIL
jgi:hypothetical protein